MYAARLDTPGFPTGADTGGFPVPVFDLIGGTLLTTVSHLEDTLTFTAPANVSDGASSTVRFAVDVPDGLGSTFTLRQSPIPVPQPAAATLFCVGLALALGRSGSRRRRTL